MPVDLTQLRIAVVGASLGGLSAANVLHRLGATVEVFECFDSGFEQRGGALGAVDVGLLEEIRGRDGYQHRIRGHGHFYGDLWQYLHQGLASGTISFGAEVMHVTDEHSSKPGLQLAGEDAPRRFDLVIGADGGKSTIRSTVTEQVPVYSGYTLWRGLVTTEGVAGPPSGSATHGGFSYQTLGFPVSTPSGALWNCGVYMATPEEEVQPPTRNRQVTASMRRVPEWFVPFVRRMFGDYNAEFWEAAARKGKVSPHPVWELAADRVVSNRVALLGDAAHMASPRTGAGAYTAMTDAVVLRDAMEQAETLSVALELYNENTVARGKRLYAQSRQAATYFAPKGRTPVSPSALVA